MKLEFLDIFYKNTPISIFMKIYVPCEQADGRKGRHDEAKSRFSQIRERA
jgi:hypothetical protein